MGGEIAGTVDVTDVDSSGGAARDGDGVPPGRVGETPEPGGRLVRRNGRWAGRRKSANRSCSGVRVEPARRTVFRFSFSHSPVANRCRTMWRFTPSACSCERLTTPCWSLNLRASSLVAIRAHVFYAISCCSSRAARKWRCLFRGAFRLSAYLKLISDKNCAETGNLHRKSGVPSLNVTLRADEVTLGGHLATSAGAGPRRRTSGRPGPRPPAPARRLWPPAPARRLWPAALEQHSRRRPPRPSPPRKIRSVLCAKCWSPTGVRSPCGPSGPSTSSGTPPSPSSPTRTGTPCIARRRTRATR